MSDQQITCSECGGSFVFSESERQFYETKRLTPPKRCKTCRLARKAAEGGQGGGGGFRAPRDGAREAGARGHAGQAPRRGDGPERAARAPAWGRMNGDAARGPRNSPPEQAG